MKKVTVLGLVLGLLLVPSATHAIYFPNRGENSTGFTQKAVPLKQKKIKNKPIKRPAPRHCQHVCAVNA